MSENSSPIHQNFSDGSSSWFSSRNFFCTAALAGLGVAGFFVYRKFSCESQKSSNLSPENSETMGNGYTKVSTDQPESAWNITINPMEEILTVPRISPSDSGFESLPGSNSMTKIVKKSSNIVKLVQIEGFSAAEYEKKLIELMQSLYQNSRPISAKESRALVALIERQDENLLQTLTTIGNLAAFQVNQDHLREEGGLKVLLALLGNEKFSDSTQIMMVQAISNLAVNPKNQKELQPAVPKLVEKLAAKSSASELLKMISLRALTNLTLEVGRDLVDAFIPLIPVLYERLESSHIPTIIQALKLMVNLACCPDVIPYFLVAKAPQSFKSLFNATQDGDVLLRSTMFFFHLSSTVDALGLEIDQLPVQIYQIPALKTVYGIIFGRQFLPEWLQMMKILEKGPNSEVAEIAKRCEDVLKRLEKD